jgi:hypothetical protein
MGSGGGGTGGFAFAGSGGEGGEGGGVSTHAAQLMLTGTTIASNTAGTGGTGSSTATGGDGGAGGPNAGSGGSATFVEAGSGGGGGAGGGVVVRSTNAGSASAVLSGDTVAGNQTGAAANGGNADSGGNPGTPGAGGGGGGPGGSEGGSGGEAGFGAGLELDAQATVKNVTVTGNHAPGGGNGGAGGTGPGRSDGGGAGEGGFGGGIDADSGSLSHVTAVGNTVGDGGAAGAAGTGSPATAGFSEGPGDGADLDAFTGGNRSVSVSASIFGLCAGTPVDGGGNIAGAAAMPCPGLVADAKLGALQDNGGPAQTMALGAGSPAIDRVPAPCGTAPDERGVARPQGGGCDAGAYEHAPPGASTGTASGVGETTATVAGTVTPNARATTWHIEFGPTAAYGSRTPDQTAPAGLAPVAVSRALSRLKPHAVVHYRLVATNADGTTAGSDATLTTAKFAGVGVTSRSLKVSRTGKLLLKLSCPATAVGSCRGTAAIVAKRSTLAHATFKLAAGVRKALHLRLDKAARRRLTAAGRRGLSVTIAASATDGTGTRVKTSARVKLTRS